MFYDEIKPLSDQEHVQDWKCAAWKSAMMQFILTFFDKNVSPFVSFCTLSGDKPKHKGRDKKGRETLICDFIIICYHPKIMEK